MRGVVARGGAWAFLRRIGGMKVSEGRGKARGKNEIKIK
jgi:hypothetical protein